MIRSVIPRLVRTLGGARPKVNFGVACRVQWAT